MLKVKFTYFDIDNPKKIYETLTGEFPTWDSVIKFGQDHADSLMKFFGLEEICWDYNTFEMRIKDHN